MILHVFHFKDYVNLHIYSVSFSFIQSLGFDEHRNLTPTRYG